MTEQIALDVWLKFTSPGDEEPTYEANTFADGEGFRVEWYHVDVGQVSTKTFATRAEASSWLESQGFQDFTS